MTLPFRYPGSRCTSPSQRIIASSLSLQPQPQHTWRKSSRPLAYPGLSPGRFQFGTSRPAVRKLLAEIQPGHPGPRVISLGAPVPRKEIFLCRCPKQRINLTSRSSHFPFAKRENPAHPPRLRRLQRTDRRSRALPRSYHIRSYRSCTAPLSLR